MTLLSSLVGMPRAPIFPYDGCGPGRGRSGTRPPVAVPTVNASALVTPTAVAKTNFMTGNPSPAGCYRCLRSTGSERWAVAHSAGSIPSGSNRSGIPLCVGDLGDLLASEQYALSGCQWQGAAAAKT